MSGLGADRLVPIRGAVGGTTGGVCAPWIPPVFVDAETSRALEEASGSRPETVVDPRLPGRAAGGVLSGVKIARSGKSWTKYGAKYVSSSDNAKIGAMDATWASITATCVDCAWGKAGTCYALGGNAKYVVSALDAEAKRARRGSVDTSFDEAAVIDASYHTGEPCETGVPAGRVLRVHASGDTSTIEGARAIAAAISRWKKRGGATAYSYTHAWRRVPRAAFGELSVLASIDNLADVPAALAQGYGSVTVLVTEDTWAQNFTIRPDGDLVFKKFPVPRTTTNLSFVPCPAQFPVDKPSNHEASRWKALYVGRLLGLIEPPVSGSLDTAARRRARAAATKRVLSIFVPHKHLYTCGTESLTHLPETREKLPVYTARQQAEQQALRARIVAAGLPPPESEAFLRVMRRIEAGEKSTCAMCRLCFDDKLLGKKGQAVAFRPDFSGGIVKTEALLRKISR